MLHVDYSNLNAVLVIPPLLLRNGCEFAEASLPSFFLHESWMKPNLNLRYAAGFQDHIFYSSCLWKKKLEWLTSPTGKVWFLFRTLCRRLLHSANCRWLTTNAKLRQRKKTSFLLLIDVSWWSKVRESCPKTMSKIEEGKGKVECFVVGFRQAVIDGTS